MTSTNYLSPQDFKKIINAIPLVAQLNKDRLIGWSKQMVPNPQDIQDAFYIQYCCALRISEVINLTFDNFNFKRNILTLLNTKTGKGKKQFTSIPPDLPLKIISWIKANQKDYPSALLFSFNRQLLYSYIKKASLLSGLDLYEQQETREITGAWTHLIRKSRAKLMIELGAAEVLVKVKLRHKFTTTERYTRPDINTLIQWENENLSLS